jgi:hypothetical protein
VAQGRHDVAGGGALRRGGAAGGRRGTAGRARGGAHLRRRSGLHGDGAHGARPLVGRRDPAPLSRADRGSSGRRVHAPVGGGRVPPVARPARPARGRMGGGGDAPRLGDQARALPRPRPSPRAHVGVARSMDPRGRGARADARREGSRCSPAPGRPGAAIVRPDRRRAEAPDAGPRVPRTRVAGAPSVPRDAGRAVRDRHPLRAAGSLRALLGAGCRGSPRASRGRRRRHRARCRHPAGRAPCAPAGAAGAGALRREGPVPLRLEGGVGRRGGQEHRSERPVPCSAGVEGSHARPGASAPALPRAPRSTDDPARSDRPQPGGPASPATRRPSDRTGATISPWCCYGPGGSRRRCASMPRRGG